MNQNIIESISKIKSANRHLGVAMQENGYKWTKATDRAIELARQELMDIMELLASAK